MPPQSRKKQAILFTAINECWPSREFLVLPHDEHSCGQHPCSFSVVTFSSAYSTYFQDSSEPCFLVKIKKIEFWQNRSTKLLELLQFHKDACSKFKLWEWLLLFPPLPFGNQVNQMLQGDRVVLTRHHSEVRCEHHRAIASLKCLRHQSNRRKSLKCDIVSKKMHQTFLPRRTYKNWKEK